MISLSLASNGTKLLCGVYSMFCKIYFEASDQIVRGAVWVWARLNLKLLNDRLLILRRAPREPAESSLDPIWQLFLQRHIASHRIASHHITAHHITLHRITSHHDTSLNRRVNIIIVVKNHTFHLTVTTCSIHLLDKNHCSALDCRDAMYWLICFEK